MNITFPLNSSNPPFGMVMPGRNWVAGTADGYGFGFNGKIMDDASYQDYGFRYYDTKVGRFISVDPMARDYSYYTPFQFAGNKPIWCIDIDGLEDGIATQLQQNAWEKQDELYDKGVINYQELEERRFKMGTATAMGVSLGIGVVLTRGVILRYSPTLMVWTMTNPVTAEAAAIAIISAISGYDGPDLPGPGDDFGKMGRKGYEALIKKGVTDNEELGKIAREAYNTIVGKIDTEIKSLGTMKEKAEKAYEIRNLGKDLARELSGPENKAAAEAMSIEKHKNINGPTFDELFKKFKDEGLSDDKAYQKIIDSAKDTNPIVNKKYKKN